MPPDLLSGTVDIHFKNLSAGVKVPGWDFFEVGEQTGDDPISVCLEPVERLANPDGTQSWWP